MTKLKTIATLALTGAVTLSPMLALADTGASVQVNANADASTTVHPALDAAMNTSLKLKLDANASTTAARKAAAEANKAANQQARVQKQQTKGENQVDARIAVLQQLEARINAMKQLTADEKAALVADLNTQISALTALKSQITSDTSTTTLLADLKTIRPDYRTYLLVLPRTAIIAAANRVMDIATQMTTEGTKLEARITAAQNAGVNVSAAQSAYTDYQAKVADAKVQAQAAIDLVKDLNVDQGNPATLASNTAALKAARAKLQVARTDLKDARKDMTTIMQVVRVKGSGSATTTVSST